MKTIYASLLEFGYSDEEIRNSVEELNPRQFGMSVIDTPDGVPIVGVSYVCDYKAEEELGVAELAKMFNGQENQIENIRIDKEGVGFVAKDFVYNMDNRMTRGASYWNQAIQYAQGIKDIDTFRMTVKDMRKWAKGRGLSLTGLTKREDIEQAVLREGRTTQIPKFPNRFPGWFQSGDVLFLRATAGIVRDTLGLLVRAAQTDDLGVSKGGGPFSTGFGFYQTTDIGPLLQAEITGADDQYRKDMDALEPVAAELKDRGYNWYFLGNPSDINGAKRYWLNGYSLPKIGQPFGWYTLDELLAEQFVTDQEIEAARKAYRYDSRGNTRKDIIYTEVGEIDYRAMAERDGTSLEGLALED